MPGKMGGGAAATSAFGEGAERPGPSAKTRSTPSSFARSRASGVSRSPFASTRRLPGAAETSSAVTILAIAAPRRPRGSRFALQLVQRFGGGTCGGLHVALGAGDEQATEAAERAHLHDADVGRL